MFDWLIFFFAWKESESKLGSAFFLVCDKNPKVNEGLANIQKISKEIRDQVCQLITVPMPFYQKDFQTKSDIT